MQQTILKKQQKKITTKTSIYHTVCKHTPERLKRGAAVLIAGLSNYYNKTEVDAKIADTFLQELGFGTYTDTQYTIESPLVVNNTAIHATIDGLGSTTEKRYLPGGTELYDTEKGEINVRDQGDTLTARVNFKARTPILGDFDILITINDDNPVVIGRSTLQMVKGINVEQSFSETISMYGLDTFLADGAKIIFDTQNDSLDLSVYDLQIFIKKTS